jgi:GxxExxY protein
MMEASDFKYKELTYKIIGCAMEVHKVPGAGFQEYIYQNALALEMKNAGVHFEKEFEMKVLYKAATIGLRRVDFFVEHGISVEIKTKSELLDEHLAQALNYLEASNIEVGLLFNFGAKSLQHKRLLNKKYNPG